MNTVNSFITSFCVSSIILGLLFVLVPKGALNKSVKYIFSLCFVCCIVGSAVGLKAPDFSAFEAMHNQQIITEYDASSAAQAVFCEALNSQNINFRKITVDTNKLTDGSIIISKVTVYTSDNAKKIIDAIGSDSYEVVIINE